MDTPDFRTGGRRWSRLPGTGPLCDGNRAPLTVGSRTRAPSTGIPPYGTATAGSGGGAQADARHCGRSGAGVRPRIR